MHNKHDESYSVVITFNMYCVCTVYVLCVYCTRISFPPPPPGIPTVLCSNRSILGVYAGDYRSLLKKMGGGGGDVLYILYTVLYVQYRMGPWGRGINVHTV